MNKHIVKHIVKLVKLIVVWFGWLFFYVGFRV
jgi:hypothetical protein